MNAKEKFINWINSKNIYKGVNKSTIIDRYLTFLDFNPFIVSDDFSDIEEIKAKLKTQDKKLKLSNEDFIKFNNNSQSGAPSAIMGSENFSKFLDELKASYEINKFTPYFNLSGIEDYKKVSGTTYDSSTKEADWYYDTRGKLYYLVNLLGELLNEEFIIVYTEQPNAQKGRGKILFKDYILAGFAPKLNNIKDDLFLKISFSGLKTNPCFAVDLDLNFRKASSKFNSQRNEIYNKSLFEWKINDNFPNNWNDLLNLINPQVTKLLEEFKKLTLNKSENQKKTMKNISLNNILYGPPGTGKTYNTINKAISIINPDFDLTKDRNLIKEEYEKLVLNNQISFTTFHQSMSYEDFIEGIKPLTKNKRVTYSVVDGIFKSIARNAMGEYIKNDSLNEGNNDFESLYIGFIDSIKPFEGKREGVFKTKTGVEIMLVSINEDSILIKYLWSNNKKESEGQHTFSVTKEKLKRVLVEGIDPSEIKNLKVELHPLVGHIHCELFAVYKKFYEFVIESKGEIDTVHFDNEELTYKEVKEQFDELTKDHIKSNNVKPYVLIIDEINRGNVSQIFGELITLIEDSKRLRNDEALEVTLPYSKDKFGVPPNLYIIGTMNTADRSVEALDTALRRRFNFEEMPPKYDLEELANEVYGYPLKDILETINKRIVRLLNNDHAIGHSYFLNKDEDSIIESFNRNIIPLLQEYFFGDYGKMMLVLGDGFVTYDEWKEEDKFFASYTETKNDYDVKDLYSIKNYKAEEKEVFAEALKKLMNR